MKTSYKKIFDGIGPVLFEPSRRARHIVISVRAPKDIRVAVPVRTPLKNAEAFVLSKIEWINKQLAKIDQYEKYRKTIQGSSRNIDRAVAKRALTTRLKKLAEKHGFAYNRVYIRNQRTRWGSCSHQNNISLNVKLVLLPEELIDYVILHELVHTLVHNHSRKFWAELDRYTGNSKVLSKRLKMNDLRLM